MSYLFCQNNGKIAELSLNEMGKGIRPTKWFRKRFAKTLAKQQNYALTLYLSLHQIGLRLLLLW